MCPATARQKASSESSRKACAAALTQRQQALEGVLARQRSALAALERRHAKLAERLDRETLRRGRGDSVARQGFDEAIALSRRGAATDELVTACGLQHGEAQLIRRLYGARPEAGSGGEELRGGDVH